MNVTKNERNLKMAKATVITTIDGEKTIKGYIDFSECFPEPYDIFEIQGEISGEIYNADTNITRICRSSVSAFFYKDDEFIGLVTHQDVEEYQGIQNLDIAMAVMTSTPTL